MKRVYAIISILSIASICNVSASEAIHHKTSELSAVEMFQGWNSLSSETSFSKWKASKAYNLSGQWAFTENTISLTPGAGDLYSINTYTNFELELEWKIESGGQSGIIISALPESSPAWKSGFRFQLADNTSSHISESRKEFSGSCYHLIAASDKAQYKNHQWNKIRIVKENQRFSFYLNGTKTVDFRANDKSLKNSIQGSKTYQDLLAFGNFQPGCIVLEDRGSAISFRNVKIRSLEAFISADGLSPELD